MSRSIEEALHALRQSSFRSKFRLKEKDLSYTRNKGMQAIRRHAFDFIDTRLAPPFPRNDGKQTPMKNHPVFIAQHATATCCRGCLRKWHGIQKGKHLTTEEKAFIVDLIMAWIERQVQAAETKTGSDGP